MKHMNEYPVEKDQRTVSSDREVVWWPDRGEPGKHDVTALTPKQAQMIAEVSKVMRCKPSDALCAMALAWLDMAQPDAPEMNAMWLNDALARYVQRGVAPRFTVDQLTTNSRERIASA